jgi:4-diphosphocytidyl-2-C-methyl-D-erythritol kinase
MLTVLAPAKLNLTLEVIRKREDGYHEIRSVVQTLSLCDKLEFSISSTMNYACDLQGWDAGLSLVSKAADLIRKESGKSLTARIVIRKQIPVSSGLGGDSSNAVAVLRGLNQLWDLNLPLPRLLELAAELGSDTSLFLYGGTVLTQGRGEKAVPLSPMPPMSVIILFPPVPEIKNKTSRLYAQLQYNHFTSGKFTDVFIEKLNNKDISESNILFNVFDQVGFDFFPALNKYKQYFLGAGAGEVHLAGSGPTLFTLVRDPQKAAEIHKHLQDQKLEAHLTGF